jgi:hypothetical protein
MLHELKKRMKSSDVRIMILTDSFHMSFYGYINPCVFFTKDLQQYLIYKDHQMYGILDSTITLSQMLK